MRLGEARRRDKEGRGAQRGNETERETHTHRHAARHNSFTSLPTPTRAATHARTHAQLRNPKSGGGASNGAGANGAGANGASDGDARVFSFDQAYGADSQQREVFDVTARPIVDAVMAGYNGAARGRVGGG